MARIIGLDIGERRIGVAISDETETIASGIETIQVKSTADSIKTIEYIITRYNVKEAVVGLPLNMNGTRGPAAEKALNFTAKLRNRFSINISTFDERLTTKQGEAIFLQAGMSRAKRKAKIDKMAAQIMLQAYLDSIKEKGA